MNKLKKIILFLIGFCIVYFAVLYFFQLNFLFGPDKKYKTPQEAGFDMFTEEVVTAKDGTHIMTWHFKGDDDKPLILYFHGNTGLMARFAPAITRLTDAGYSVDAAAIGEMYLQGYIGLDVEGNPDYNMIACRG